MVKVAMPRPTRNGSSLAMSATAPNWSTPCSAIVRSNSRSLPNAARSIERRRQTCGLFRPRLAQLAGDLPRLDEDLVARQIGSRGLGGRMYMGDEPALAAMLDLDIGGVLAALHLLEIGQDALLGLGRIGDRLLHSCLPA